jgi:hypothetical protein
VSIKLTSFHVIIFHPVIEKLLCRIVIPLVELFWFNDAIYESFFHAKLIGAFKINVWGFVFYSYDSPDGSVTEEWNL